MKTLTIRLPEKVAAEIEAESRQRKVSKSDIVRERLETPYRVTARSPMTLADAVPDLMRELDAEARRTAHLPKQNISGNIKKILRKTGYGKNRSR